jgi:hypothetical protein
VKTTPYIIVVISILFLNSLQAHAASSPEEVWINCLFNQLPDNALMSVAFGTIYKSCQKEQLALERAVYNEAPEKLRKDTVKAVIRDSKKLFEKTVRTSLGK